MKIQSGISNAGLLAFIILILSLAFVYFFYQFKKDNDEFTQTQRTLLSFVRFIYLALISMLLISPLIEIIKTRLEKPILIVGIDNSQSLGSNKAQTETIVSIKNELYSAYNDKFDLQLITFGEKVTTNLEPDFSEKTSNYAEFIDEVDKRFYNLNVGAIVLVGDGNYNKGENPVQLADQIPCPVYAIGIGDTLNSVDQAIINAVHNQNVFLGNTFPVEVEATFANYTEPTAQLQIFASNKLVFSEEVDIPQPDYYFNKTISVKAETPGLMNVSVQLVPFQNETNTANNYVRFTIEVHENKNNVLFLTQGPHPDIGAMTLALDKQANFKVTVASPNDRIDDLNKYNLIVFNQLPSLSLQESELLKRAMGSTASLLAMLGPNSSISAFNNLQLGFSLNSSTTTQECFPFFDESYSIFSLPPSLQNVSSVYPPLISYFTDYKIGPEYSVLAHQKINNIEMNYPLIATGVVNNRKIGIICGEGIWRWRLSEFQNFDNQTVFDQLVVNFFNYLCLKEVREQFKVTYDRIIPETSPVKIRAQVFNELFEPVPNLEVGLVVTDSANAEMSYMFDVQQNNYGLNLGYLAPGNYTFRASTKIGEKEFSKEGTFDVEEINLENQNTQGNFRILYTLAQKTGGNFYTQQNWKELLKTLENNQTIKLKYHKEKNVNELIDWKWLFAIVFLLFSLEWFLRKFWGSY